MEKKDKNNRVLEIRAQLHFGDISKIARKAGVHRNWVDLVLRHQGTSERILQVAEDFVKNRNLINQNSSHENTN